MRKNIKIKLLNILIKYFILLNIFIFLIPLYSFSQTAMNGEKKSDDLEFLPGEEVITNTGKKMNVWSSKGTFKLNGKEDSNNSTVNNNQVPQPQVIIVKENNDRRRRRRK